MPNYYFDANATTPAAEEVVSVMQPFWRQHFGNPSSIHQSGKFAAKAVRSAREAIAAAIKAGSDSEIIFTSGGTESNNLAILSALKAFPEKKEIVTSTVEHSSIRKLCSALGKEGYTVKKAGVDLKGILDLEELKKSITGQTAIVSLMADNNETGVSTPIEQAGAIVKSKNILFHVDAVQTFGKKQIDLKAQSFIDYLSLSAHKFYGPKGAGVLFVRGNNPVRPLLIGGAQERGRRAGTENVAGIVGMGKACELAVADFDGTTAKMEKLRNEFEKLILEQCEGVVINGDVKARLPNTSNLRFNGVDGEALLFALDQRGVYASSGSACMSGAREPSHVLTAMGLSEEEANASLRFSFGRYNERREISEAADIIAEVATELRKLGLAEQHVH